MSIEFKEFCNLNDILHQLTAPRSPQQNGIVERKNQTVTEMACTMLQEAGMPPEFWGETVATAVFITNRSLTRALENQTLFEDLTGSKPRVNFFRVFGCLAYRLVDPQ